MDVRVASRDRRIIADPSKDRGEQHTAKTVALLGQGRGYIRNRVRVRRSDPSELAEREYVGITFAIQGHAQNIVRILFQVKTSDIPLDVHCVFGRPRSAAHESSDGELVVRSADPAAYHSETHCARPRLFFLEDAFASFIHLASTWLRGFPSFGGTYAGIALTPAATVVMWILLANKCLVSIEIYHTLHPISIHPSSE